MEPLIEQGAQPQLPAVGRRLMAVAKSFTTPHLPDDYLALLDPRWSLEEAVATVERRIVEAEGVVTLVLRPSFPWPGHEAGQYVRVGAEIKGIRHWRAFTVTSDPGHPEGLVSITVQRVDGGLMSGHLTDDAACGVGARVWLGQVEGEFTMPPGPVGTPLLLISAGCGVTPIWAMVRELERRGALHDVVHLHSARDPSRFVFGRPLRELAGRTPGYALHEHHSGADGRLHRQDLDRLVPDWRDRQAFLSGPGEMLDDFERHWTEHGDPALLHLERFRPSIGLGGGIGEGGTVTFGVSRVSAEAEPGVSILVAGERAGAALPSGCRMGICHSCIGRLKQGQVQDLRTGLVHGEPGQPVRTCVNGPCGDIEIEL
ncbi:MAG: ferredoxin reductase [Solirubrobacteraceae bacterium]|nr:ferredoxin reductase [Solirubrobacteraceae bacterium]